MPAKPGVCILLRRRNMEPGIGVDKALFRPTSIRIIVIHDGAILEQGNHESLLAENGQYASLFRLQAKGYQ